MSSGGFVFLLNFGRIIESAPFVYIIILLVTGSLTIIDILFRSLENSKQASISYFYQLIIKNKITKISSNIEISAH